MLYRPVRLGTVRTTRPGRPRGARSLCTRWPRSASPRRSTSLVVLVVPDDLVVLLHRVDDPGGRDHQATVRHGYGPSEKSSEPSAQKAYCLVEMRVRFPAAPLLDTLVSLLEPREVNESLAVPGIRVQLSSARRSGTSSNTTCADLLYANESTWAFVAIDRVGSVQKSEVRRLGALASEGR
jgi:hypothetical protein